MAKAAGVGRRPWQGAEGQGGSPPPTCLHFQCCKRGLHRVGERWPDLKASGVAQETLRGAGERCLCWEQVVWVIKAQFSPALAFSVAFLRRLGWHQPLPLCSPADRDAPCGVVAAGLGLGVWFGW